MKCKGKINCDFFVKLAKNAKLKEYAGLIQVELHEPYPNDYTKNPVT